MTLDEINAAIKAKGYNITTFASQLGMTADALGRILSGKRPLTESLHNHISLLLKEPREAILVYRVDITESKAAELCGANCCANPEDRKAAIEAIIHHNLAELIEAGKRCAWTPEERDFLGLPPAPAASTAPAYDAEASAPYA